MLGRKACTQSEEKKQLVALHVEHVASSSNKDDKTMFIFTLPRKSEIKDILFYRFGKKSTTVTLTLFYGETGKKAYSLKSAELHSIDFPIEDGGLIQCVLDNTPVYTHGVAKTYLAIATDLIVFYEVKI